VPAAWWVRGEVAPSRDPHQRVLTRAFAALAAFREAQAELQPVTCAGRDDAETARIARAIARCAVGAGTTSPPISPKDAQGIATLLLRAHLTRAVDAGRN
jgi:hypothetical protein